MAVYKVIQDIEAEDKLLGPLTLKAFIYAIITGFLMFVNFRLLLSPQLGAVRWVVILVLLFPMLLFGVLAAPLGREQPTEVWLLSHVRFLLKPHLRVWNQSGQRELVTITAPKAPEKALTKSFSQTEVKSRLKTLATALDTRGWAFKNINANLTDNPALMAQETETDRLVGSAVLPQEVPTIDIRAEDDILDADSNVTAQKFSQLMQTKDTQKKQAISARMQSALSTSAPTGTTVTAAWQPPSLPAAAAQPPATTASQTAAATTKTKASTSGVTDPAHAVKLKELAQSGELKVSSISKLANHKPEPPPDEVVIKLH